MTAATVPGLADQIGALWESNRYNPTLLDDPVVGPKVEALMRAGHPVTYPELTRNDAPVTAVPIMRWVARPLVGWMVWADLPPEKVARRAVSPADLASCDLCGAPVSPESDELDEEILPVSTGQSVWLFVTCFRCNERLEERWGDLRWM